MATKLLINLRPKTVNDIPVTEDFKAVTEDVKAVLAEYGTDWDDVTGNITINKNNTLITEEGHLVFLYPDKLWYAVALEPDEFVILMEQEVDDEVTK